MSEKRDGGPAFPHRELNSDGLYEFSAGMSLRDYVAGLAMQGFASTRAYIDEVHIARAAYNQADAMLKAREASDELHR